jgi:hypothetical protein
MGTLSFLGRSLVNNGNSNHFCGNHVFYTFEIYSFYCKVIARYVTIQRLEQEALIFANAEIVVNPETTGKCNTHLKSGTFHALRPCHEVPGKNPT